MTTSSSRRSLRRRFAQWTKQTSRHDKQRRQFRPLLEQLEDRRLLAPAFTEFVDPHPEPGNGFGDQVLPLSTGNVVIIRPMTTPEARTRARFTFSTASRVL